MLVSFVFVFVFRWVHSIGVLYCKYSGVVVFRCLLLSLSLHRNDKARFFAVYFVAFLNIPVLSASCYVISRLWPTSPALLLGERIREMDLVLPAETLLLLQSFRKVVRPPNGGPRSMVVSIQPLVLELLALRKGKTSHKI
jgi:hypothetical protein